MALRCFQKDEILNCDGYILGKTPMLVEKHNRRVKMLMYSYVNDASDGR